LELEGAEEEGLEATEVDMVSSLFLLLLQQIQLNRRKQHNRDRKGKIQKEQTKQRVIKPRKTLLC
jgi:hypothetical protein